MDEIEGELHFFGLCLGFRKFVVVKVLKTE